MGTRVGSGISFQKIPLNRLGTASVIPRKKLLIPRHSEVYGRVYSEARNVRKWHEKISFTKNLSPANRDDELTACFRLRHASERNSSFNLFRRMVRNRIKFWSLASNFVPWYRIPSIFLLCGMVRNGIPRIFCSAEHPELSWNKTNCSVYSVFRGIIFCRKLPTLMGMTGIAPSARAKRKYFPAYHV